MRARDWRTIRLTLRRATPLAGILLGMIVAQALLWICGKTGFWGLLLACSLGARQRRLRESVCTGALIAAASSIPTVFCYDAFPAHNDVILAIRIQDEPRYPKVGLIQLTGQLLNEGWQEHQILVSGVHLPWRNASRIALGDAVWMRGSCIPVVQTANPFSYDGSLVRKGITGRCKATFFSSPQRFRESEWGKVRQKITTKSYLLGGEHEGTGLLLAMTFGLRDQLSDGTERAFRSLGLTHLLVVSGYQISLVFEALLYLALQVLLRVPFVASPRTLALYPAVVGAAGYVWLCGTDAATLRALVAGVCIAIQIRFELCFGMLHRIFLALLLLNIVIPFANFDLGVHFTLAALLGIASGLFVTRGRGKAIQIVAVSWHLWLTTTLVNLIWFGTMVPMSLIMNLLLAAPWSTLNCVAGSIFLVVATLPVPWAAIPLEAICNVNYWLLTVVRCAAQWCEPLIITCDEVSLRIFACFPLCALLLWSWRKPLSDILATEGRSALPLY